MCVCPVYVIINFNPVVTYQSNRRNSPLTRATLSPEHHEDEDYADDDADDDADVSFIYSS